MCEWGARSHLCYVSNVRNQGFKNFEFMKIDEMLIVDYTESDKLSRSENIKGHFHSSRTFAHQFYDTKSIVHYKNIKFKPLPDNLPTLGVPINDPEFETKLIELSGKNFHFMNINVHLKGCLTMDEALANACKYGFSYDFAVNCELKIEFEMDEVLQEYLTTFKKSPVDNYFQRFAMAVRDPLWRKKFGQISSSISSVQLNLPNCAVMPKDLIKTKNRGLRYYSSYHVSVVLKMKICSSTPRIAYKNNKLNQNICMKNAA
jgi:hypothetical protein